jgi:hypothetical protein
MQRTPIAVSIVKLPSLLEQMPIDQCSHIREGMMSAADQSPAVHIRFVAIVFLCIGLLFGGLITQIKQNISIHYRDGRAAVRCLELPGSF